MKVLSYPDYLRFRICLSLTLFMCIQQSNLWAEFDYLPPEARDPKVPYEKVPVLRPSDRIGWSSDGNFADPDDWSAAPVALAAIAASGYREQFVHFSYNNRLDRTDPIRMRENEISTLGSAERLGFSLKIFYNLWNPDEYNAAFENAVQQVLASGPDNRFFWVQAGPFEFAYRVLQEAAVNRGATKDNIKYTILVSHSEINEKDNKWNGITDAVTGRPRPSAGAKQCVEEFGAGFFYTGQQYKERFGGKTNVEAWDYVDWMRTSEQEIFRWMYHRFEVTRDFHVNRGPENKNKNGLDASDGGMAFTLVTGNYNGNLNLWSNLVRGFTPVGKAKINAGERPNIIIFLADDLGYSSVQPFGDKYGIDAYVQTPAIARLAAEGRVFTEASTPSSVCSPTRYALLTGCYNWRTGKTYGTYPVNAPLSIDLSRPTIQKMLKNEGYATAHVGKWHLGYQNTSTDYNRELTPGPNDIDFDYHWGIPSNNGDVTGVWVENNWVWGLNKPIPEGFTTRPSTSWMGRDLIMPLDAPYREDHASMAIILDRAKNWITENRNGPFFLYYAFPAVHIPITPGVAYQGTSNAGPYGDFIQEVDGSVGDIMQLLTDLGISDNTLVLFTSDNGWDYYYNFRDNSEEIPSGFKTVGDYRGSKHTIWEAGFRVPYIVRWPGHVPAGTLSNEMLNLVDTYATIAAALRIDMPSVSEGAEDSFNMLPAWLGESYESPIRDHMIQTNSTGVVAVRQGNMKFINGIPADPKVNLETMNPDNRRFPEYHRQLYDLEHDMGETNEIDPASTTVDEELEALFHSLKSKGFSRPND